MLRDSFSYNSAAATKGQPRLGDVCVWTLMNCGTERVVALFLDWAPAEKWKTLHQWRASGLWRVWTCFSRPGHLDWTETELSWVYSPEQKGSLSHLRKQIRCHRSPTSLCRVHQTSCRPNVFTIFWSLLGKVLLSSAGSSCAFSQGRVCSRVHINDTCINWLAYISLLHTCVVSW